MPGTEPKVPPVFRPVFDGQHLRAALFPGTRPELVVTLDYRRVGRSGFSAPNHSSGFARQGYGQLSITTRVNDWFINPDTRALEHALAPVVAGYDQVRALGYSMGGYGALRLARVLRLTGVVAVSPQATLAVDAVPDDRRYRAEARGFDAALGDLAQVDRPDLTGVLFLDPFVSHDLAHARLIQARFPLLKVVRLGFAGHPATRVLRAGGKAWLVQREVVTDRQDGAEVRAAHRAARSASAGYWDRLARQAAGRRPALAALARARSAALDPRGGAADAYGG